MEFSKDLLFKLSVFTLFGFSILGMAIIYAFQGIRPDVVLFAGEPWLWQLLYGLAYGVAAGLLGLTVVRLQLLEPVTSFYTQLFENLDLTFEDIIFYSFCAGVGEEIFFRAALQPFLGIWLTALGFVALHGYLTPRNWRMSLYGVLLVVIVAGMGYLFHHFGLMAAIAAHFAFDVLMFSYLVYFKKA